MKHYVAHGGTPGCLPDNCTAYITLEGAINILDEIYELSDEQKDALRESQYTTLTSDQGGQYCSIDECDCDEPWDHDEFGEKNDWMIEEN